MTNFIMLREKSYVTKNFSQFKVVKIQVNSAKKNISRIKKKNSKGEVVLFCFVSQVFEKKIILKRSKLNPGQ